MSVLGMAAALVASILIPTAAAEAAETLLSQGKPATASSIEAAGFEAGKAVDGNASTRWASVEGHDPEWIQVDLGSAQAISRVKLTWEAAYAKSYQVRISTDGSTWTTAFSTTSGNGATDDLTVAGTARYVRINGTARGTSYGYSLYEFQVYGGDGGPPPGGGDAAVPFGGHTIPYAAGMLRPSGVQ
jgi:hypothetical protein